MSGRFTPRPRYHREITTVPNELEAEWATELVWTFSGTEKSSTPPRIRTPDCPDLSLVTKQKTLLSLQEKLRAGTNHFVLCDFKLPPLSKWDRLFWDFPQRRSIVFVRRFRIIYRSHRHESCSPRGILLLLGRRRWDGQVVPKFRWQPTNQRCVIFQMSEKSPFSFCYITFLFMES
jgi:hypothetical protein